MSIRRRVDGDLVRDLDPSRRVMPYLMKGRNESAFYFEEHIQLQRCDAWLREFNRVHPEANADVFTLALWAIRDCMERWPTMNRFVAGGRLYQRRDIHFSFAVKRRLRAEDGSKRGADMATVKRRFPPGEPLADIGAGLARQVNEERFGGPSHTDKELRLLLLLPGFVRRLILKSAGVLDAWGMLPRFWIEPDPMYTSAFLAHMASFGMPAGYHHLYEYGTAGIFIVLGRPTTDPGSPVSGPERRRTMKVTFTFDERTDEGIVAWRSIQHFKRVLEDPGAVAALAAELPPADGERGPSTGLPSRGPGEPGPGPEPAPDDGAVAGATGGTP